MYLQKMVGWMWNLSLWNDRMCLCYAKGLQNDTYVLGLGPIDLYSLLVRKYIYMIIIYVNVNTAFEPRYGKHWHCISP